MLLKNKPAASSELSTEALIQEARKLLRPSPVKLGRVPLWLTRALRAAHRAEKFESVPNLGGGWMLQDAVGACGSKGTVNRWLDHWGSSTPSGWNGLECFVAEPYGLCDTDFVSIGRFAELVGAAYCVDPNSWHYPGKTIRVLFYQPSAMQEPIKQGVQNEDTP